MSKTEYQKTKTKNVASLKCLEVKYLKPNMC